MDLDDRPAQYGIHREAAGSAWYRNGSVQVYSVTVSKRWDQPGEAEPITGTGQDHHRTGSGQTLVLDIVKRETDPVDNRSYRLHLTQKGRKLVPVILEILAESTERMVAGFAPDDRERFISYLARVHGNWTDGGVSKGGKNE